MSNAFYKLGEAVVRGLLIDDVIDCATFSSVVLIQLGICFISFMLQFFFVLFKCESAGVELKSYRGTYFVVALSFLDLSNISSNL